MAEDPLVTAAEVARLAGVGRAAVSNWRRRYADFPCAAEGTAAGPRFRLSQIQRWLDEQGRSAPPSAMEQLWRALRADDETGEMAALARLARQLRAPSARLAPEPVRAALARLADTPRAELLDAVCEQFFTVQQRAHLTTPPQLAALMTELAAPFQTVFDPACGPGSLLLAAAGRGAGSVEGQEIDTGLAELAQARLGLHTHARVRPGDSLRADAFPGLRADAVLCHPPFAQRDWGHAELGIDRRWEYGFPPKGEPELAWLQHCLAHARPGGTVVLLLTAGVAARRAGRSIRQALLRRGVLRAVIGLPGGVLMTTGVPLHLWVLRAPPVEPNEPVLLLDAGEHRPARRGQVDWAALRQAVLGPWREFTETPAVPEVAGRVRSVAPIELLDEEVDLTPARHLPLPRPEFDVAATTKLRDRLAELLVTLGASLPRIEPAQRADASSTTVGELARAGALRLHQPSTGRVELDEQGVGPLVLTGRDVATGEAATLRLAAEPASPLPQLRPGDLVVPQLAAGEGQPRPQVITERGLLLGPNLVLLRVDAQRLDVDYLAGQLAAGRAARASGSTVSGVHRLDIRRVEVVVLDLAAQRAVGERFRGLRQLRARLNEVSGLGEQLCARLAEGLATGMITQE